ncbi:MAG: helix-turn-helix domain-containing protein [Oscillospiraceae bacterium]|jgi:transcriptional regulator with XRE-family HTH domain|nr:helix-turn-helix domain-containing protein [Oscillospiraceae bacterium]
MTLGGKIQQQRKQRGMSQEQLAARLTVSRQAISKWELGESSPDTENIVQLSRLFGVSTDFLLNDEFESDMDITAVKVSRDNTESRQSKRSMTVYRCILVFGLIGVLTLWILSSVIPARKTVRRLSNGPPTAVAEVHTFATPYPEAEGTEYPMNTYTTIEVRGDLLAFLTHFHFVWLFALCCASILTGGVALLRFSRRENRRV